MGSALLLLDLSAAFDTVDHRILLERLEAVIGVSGPALNWFSSYPSDRTQSVKAGDAMSTPARLLHGVPQGSVLGPSLFSIYTSPIPSFANRRGIVRHHFADDTQDLIIFALDQRHQVEALSRLADCVAETGDWFANNKVQLNIDKSVLLYAFPGSKTNQPQPLPLNIGNCLLDPSDSVRNLGVIFYSKLSMIPHVNSVYKSCFYYLTLIGRLRKFLDRESTKSLVHALVITRLDYANSLLYGLPQSALDKLQRVQNAAVRLIYGVGKREHISALRRDLHW